MSNEEQGEGSRAKLPDEAKREMLSLRVTPSSKAAIAAAAASSGRSMSQEIELRLERSFLQDAAEGSALGSDFRAAVTALLRGLDSHFGASWTESPEAFYAARAGLAYLVNEMIPDDPAFVASLGSEAATALENDRMEAAEKVGTKLAAIIRPRRWRHPGLKTSEVS